MNPDSTIETLIFWFRQDLRLSDNPGFSEAVKKGAVMPIFIVDEAGQKIGSASKWWLYHSLNSLNEGLQNKLNFYTGDAKKILFQLVQQNNVSEVYWNRCYEPYWIQKDQEIETLLRKKGVACNNFEGQLLFEPSKILKKNKTPYKVYTPFYKNCLKKITPKAPISAPEKFHLLKDINSISIEQLNLMPKKNWCTKLTSCWNVGEVAAETQFMEFLSNGLSGYQKNRNFPFLKNVSRLSPHLRFGEISPNQIWYATQERRGWEASDEDVDCFLSELVWREFSYYLLYYFPELPDKNFQKKFDNFPWQNDDFLLSAWQKGETGYPIVDAGMRELWQTGYMHNRLRMIVASFLVKNLLLHWHHGRDWFWDCLLDADLANNSANWQWVAGCGADAAPYFRIFNPVTQGEKFDKNGLYTRYFVPELKNLPDEFLFKPWEAPKAVLKKVGVVLGQNYPMPIVNLDNSRKLTLEVYRNLSR